MFNQLIKISKILSVFLFIICASLLFLNPPVETQAYSYSYYPNYYSYSYTPRYYNWYTPNYSSLYSSSNVYVSGYYKSNGTYVNSYYRTRADGIKYNNYSCIYNNRC